jgi:hypothetical protein
VQEHDAMLKLPPLRQGYKKGHEVFVVAGVVVVVVVVVVVQRPHRAGQ